MASCNEEVVDAAIGSKFNRESELKAFDDSKSGVKGVVDAGSSKIPRIFIHDQTLIKDINSSPTHAQFDIPIIDLKGSNARGDMIEKVRHASEEWGFFQITNHGIPKRVLDEMIDGVRGFHEMRTDEKIKYYSRDANKPFFYTSNFHLFHSAAATWVDSFLSVMAPNPPQSQQVATVCRDILFEYSNHVMRLGLTLLELFSEALGLKPNHLESMGCGEGLFVVGHYYPPCPQPELTLGTSSHTDAGFFTILLQDLIGGLQVFHQNHWVNVTPLPGALIVNIGDLLQLVTNDALKSVSHRVLAQKVGPRISVAALFRAYQEGIESKKCRPIKELVSEKKPPVYRETSFKEYVAFRTTNGMDGTSSLAPFKVSSSIPSHKGLV